MTCTDQQLRLMLVLSSGYSFNLSASEYADALELEKAGFVKIWTTTSGYSWRLRSAGRVHLMERCLL